MMSWSRLEVEATVVDYFHMLIQELTGQAYNKSAHRKALMNKLDNRSEGAIERKHQNIIPYMNEIYVSLLKDLAAQFKK